MSIRHQADLLSLNRSGLYYVPRGVSPEEVAMKHRIDELYTKCPFYGSRRITACLRREDVSISRKRVQRYMQEMGIEGIHPGPNLSKRALQNRIYPYLLRNVTAQYPHHIWGVDITYIRLSGGWMYLVAVIDWYSRYVVSWELDQSLEQPFVMRAVENALSKGIPVIWNSDQGSHFTSDIYTKRLEMEGIQISMDGRRRAIDNIFTERLWRSLKYEDIYLKEYRSPREARTGIENYFRFYNEERPHQSLNYKTPLEIYKISQSIKDIARSSEPDSDSNLLCLAK